MATRVVRGRAKHWTAPTPAELEAVREKAELDRARAVEDAAPPGYTPPGYVRISAEIVRLRRSVFGDRTPVYVDHLAIAGTPYAEDPALCGAMPEGVYWGRHKRGELCALCHAVAVARPNAVPVAATGWDDVGAAP